MNEVGTVYLVGAGPGDIKLITLKGIELLQKCDVIIYDRLASNRLLDYIKVDCEKIYVGKSVNNHSMKQEEINQIIIQKALENKLVVRLKGGDPFVFGRGGEEVLALKEQGIPYDIIPGITSAIAAATYAGIPLTHRGVSQGFHVITGHSEEGFSDLAKSFQILAQLNQTLVILMGMGNLYKIVQELIKYGMSKDTPVAIVSNGTTAKQKEVRGNLSNILEKVTEQSMEAPAIIIIGKVANLDMKSTLNYKLKGIRIGLIGSRELNTKLSSQIEELGAEVHLLRSAEIKEFENNKAFDAALNTLEQYTWMVFTSSYGVHITLKNLKHFKIDYRRLAKLKFAVVGSGTEETLRQYGFQADFIPEKFTGLNLARGLHDLIEKEDKILLLRAKKSSDDIVNFFNENGVLFDDMKVYDIEFKKENSLHKELLKLDQFDYLTFASSSGVHELFQNSNQTVQDRIGNTKIVCIGEATAETLHRYGYDKPLIAEKFDVKGIVDCICNDVDTIYQKYPIGKGLSL